MRVLNAAFARSIYATPWRRSVTWEDLVETLKDHGERYVTKEGLGIVGAKLLQGYDKHGTFRLLRRKSHIESLDFISFDFDENVPDDWCERLGEAFPYTRFVYTTHSHGRPEKGNRGRAIYPLTRSITPDEHAVLILWAQKRATHHGLPPDKSCKDTTRLFYTPRVQAPDGAPRIIEDIEGKGWFDPDALPDGNSVCDLLADMQAARERRAKRLAEVSYAPGEVPDIFALSESARLYSHRYAHRGCAGALERLASATPGERHLALMTATTIIGGWEASRCITSHEADTYVTYAIDILARMLGSDEDLRRQAENGRRYGLSRPFNIPKAPTEAEIAEIEYLPILEDEEEMLPVEEAREKTRAIIMAAVSKPGRTCVAADPGTGKTQAALEQAFKAIKEGLSVRFVVATNAILEERKRDLRRIIAAEDESLVIFSETFISEQNKRTAENCQNLPLVSLGRNLRGDRGAREACKACPRHPSNNDGALGCGFFREVAYEKPNPFGSILFTTHALELTTEQTPVDLLIVDEFPAQTHATYRLDLEDLVRWQGRGDLTITPESWKRLTRLFSSVTLSAEKARSHDLAAAVPAGELTVALNDDGEAKNLWGADRVGKLVLVWQSDKPQGERLDTMSSLQRTGDHQALAALDAICAQGWQGAYIGCSPRSDDEDPTPGLFIGVHETMNLQEAKSVLLLDGTCSEAVADIVLGHDGADVDYYRIPVEFDDTTSMYRMDWSASKYLFSGERQASELNVTRLRALVMRCESDSTLWVVHKSWRNSPVVQELLEAAFREKRVIHFGSAESIGSNAYQHCKRVVIADRFLPRAALFGRAESLKQAARSKEGVDWEAEAAHLTEGRDFRQTMDRVRPILSGREVVFLTKRELPRAWAKWTKPTVDLDQVAYELLGVLPGGAKGIQLRLRETVKRVGFAIPTATVTVPDITPKHQLGDLSPTVTVTQTGHGRDFPRLVTDAGLSLGYLLRGDGGNPQLVVYDSMKPPTPQQLADHLQVRGKRPPWIEWLGQRLELRDARSEFLSVLPGLPDLTIAALCSRLDVSESTFWRRLRAAGLTMERLRELWSEANRPPDVVLDDDEDDPSVLLVGGQEWLQRAPSEWVDRWRAIVARLAEPPEIPPPHLELPPEASA